MSQTVASTLGNRTVTFVDINNEYCKISSIILCNFVICMQKLSIMQEGLEA